MTIPPLDEYRQRRAARASEYARLARLDARLAHSRLAAVGAIVLSGLVVFQFSVTPWLLAIPVSAFAALATWHDRVIRAADRFQRAIAFYEHGLARLEDRWQDVGETGARFLDEDHLYTRDLDIFGRGSLFQLLSLARTHLGEEMLARWLTGAAPLPDVRQRQAAIAELREARDFREALATAGGASHDIDTVALSTWASAPAVPVGVWLRVAAVVLAVSIFVTAYWWARGGPVSPLLFVVLLKMALTRPSRTRVARVVRGVEGPLSQLDVLADTLSLIEKGTFTSRRLVEIRTEMMSHGIVPSEAIRRLRRLAEMLEWRRNAFFAIISAAVSWPLHLASAIEAWRREFGPKVMAWLSAVAEYEALSSLGAYAYEHPEDPFPSLVEDGPARFEGTSLGHPLVPAAWMVTERRVAH